MSVKTLIVIPYRDRHAHLNQFLGQTLKHFDQYLDDYQIVIVEQEPGSLFNRGWLINIAVQEYPTAQQIITQDVDTIPSEQAIRELYTLDASDMIQGLCLPVTPDTLGCVVKISRDHYVGMNGFPNNFWGWGVEDRALWNRSQLNGVKIAIHLRKTAEGCGDYFKILNCHHKRIRDGNRYITRHRQEYVKFAKLSRAQQIRHVKSSGLNNLQYHVTRKVKPVRNNPKVDKITVRVGGTWVPP